MFSASDLSKDQIEIIKGWVAEGAQMADVQKRLKNDFGFNVTYMDTRFLSLDLELDFQVEEEESGQLAPDDSESPPVPREVDLDPNQPAGGGVSATLDQVARPGSMVSGTVTFSDGMKGLWLIDEMGRPSIDPDQPGYQPSESDLVSFQEELKGLLDGHI
ncbi:hypothetical protein N9B19_03180 [Akkermansiaceae bacterium]|jgi:hypothetical protein|nr:hypothetical protein [bacterium]MDA7892058.1 hypothetical protein [Akkermansiaceae bacterium]MDA7907863.1 hypothetical protein [Akkermansiaceae bacterium]MDA7934375.1 hypothetical protein [Akkermansiaceae bacterium]MDB4370360.1 hypothetical protein [Akkermansiaceae bacterium]